MKSEKILNFLKRKKDWTIVGEIVSEINETRASVKSELIYLFHKDLVEKQKAVVLKGRGYVWKYKDPKKSDH